MVSRADETKNADHRPQASRRGTEQESTGTVVVVDDDTVWLSDLETWLSHDGFRVVGISRGEWVVDAVWFHEPDVVVLDVNLPGADGLDLLAQLRRRQPESPVIIMTAFGDFEVKDRARRLGAADYFDKPFRVKDLISAIRRVRRSPPSA